MHKIKRRKAWEEVESKVLTYVANVMLLQSLIANMQYSINT